jgi:hypothetical protein
MLLDEMRKDAADLLSSHAKVKAYVLKRASGFLDKRVRCGRLRYQLRAFFAEMIETTAQLATGQCVLIVGPVEDCRNEILPAARWPQRSDSQRGTSATGT